MKKITTKEQYDEYLAQAKDFIQSGADDDRLYVLSLVIADYEEKTFPVDNPDPIEMIKYWQKEILSKNDSQMAKTLAMSKSRFSEIINRKRKLTLITVQRCVSLGMPAKIMLKKYGDAKEAVHRKVKKLQDEIERLNNLV